MTERFRKLMGQRQSIAIDLALYNRDYKRALLFLLVKHGLMKDVELDAAGLIQFLKAEGRKDFVPRTRAATHKGKLCVWSTGDFMKPYNYAFVTKETDDDGRPIFSYIFEGFTFHDQDDIEKIFADRVLPFVKACTAEQE